MAKYLLLYNALSCLLLLYILISITTTTTTAYPTIEPYTRWTQTLSIADIFHAASGSLPLSISTY